jgi:hypothetical protein
MALANIIAAKKAGYTDQEIAEYLSQQSGADYTAAIEGGYSDKDIIKFLNTRDFGAGESFARGAERGATGFIRGGADVLRKAGIDVGATEQTGITPEGYVDPLTGMMGAPVTEATTSLATPGQRQMTDAEREVEYRAMIEQRPVATLGGYLAGAIAGDPTNLVAFSAKTALQGAKQLGGLGAVQGAVEPVYEELDDSRLRNIAFSAGGGAVFGAGFGALAGRFARKADEAAAKMEGNVPAVTKTREEIEAELPPITTVDQPPTLLSRLPDTDQAIVDKVLARYEDVDLLPNKAFDEVADALETTNPQAAALFRGAKEPPDTVAQQQAALIKADFDQKASIQSAKVTDDAFAESSSYLKAEKTGDYRDFLTDPIRNYPLSPTQFAKMIAPENPFKGQNLKTALSRDETMTDALSQLIGPTFGRFNREKAAKTWAQVEIKGESVPYETVVSAFVNRKQEEVLGAELTSKISKALASELNQLDQLKDVARLAKEQNNEEMYAYIAQRFATVNALSSSLDGNISNLGRALAYTKQVKKIINSNGTLPPYLGGLKC